MKLRRKSNPTIIRKAAST